MCPHGQGGGGGFSHCGHFADMGGGGVNFLQFCADVFYEQPLIETMFGSSRKKYDLSQQSQLLFNVSQKSAVDEVSNIIFSRSSISMLVVLILSKNNFMIVPFFDFLVFQGTAK